LVKLYGRLHERRRHKAEKGKSEGAEMCDLSVLIVDSFYLGDEDEEHDDDDDDFTHNNSICCKVPRKRGHRGLWYGS